MENSKEPFFRYTILAADDETELLDILELYLEREGIAICKARDGIEAMEFFKQAQVHLALPDIMMPGLDGFAVLRKIRETSKIPVIMLTAKSQDYDKILGLEIGADDYITKPYNPLEVVARIKAQLRRNYDYRAGPDWDLRLHIRLWKSRAGSLRICGRMRKMCSGQQCLGQRSLGK